MRMPELIKQRTTSDCAICCLAMLTGLCYEAVIEAVGDSFDPEKGMRRDYVALNRLGFQMSNKMDGTGDFIRLHHSILTPSYFRIFAFGRRALLSVPSLNIEDGLHMVYWDGYEVFDPANGKTYSRFEDLLPEEMILFQECSV